MKHVAVIGCGNMGSAVVRGLLAAKWTTPARVTVGHPDLTHAKRQAKPLGAKASSSNRKAASGADVVILGVKPQILPEVLADIAPALHAGQLIVSLAAGISTARLEALAPGLPVVRAMPNLGVTVSLGATALCAGAHASKADVATARAIFESVGTVEEVPERLMDAVTGLSGTGPMYVFQLVEGLADAGVKVGLSRDVASRLSVQTLLGSARLVQESLHHPATLKDQVTSPGGTAIAALHVLRREAWQAIIMDAVEAATKRSAELGRPTDP